MGAAGHSPSATSPASTKPLESSASATETAQSILDAGILPASHWEAIPRREDEVHDDDSGFNDVVSSTASLSSSILQYRTVLGRTYHSEIGKAEGWTPNDERHSESMDMHHHMSTLLLGGKLFLAPIKQNIGKALDVGTGTGIWAIDFGEEFPNAEVVGTDISPIQPTWVPPNVRFEIDDANLEWTWKDNTFDFVHLRCMLGTIIDWTSFYRKAFRCCKPGGWIEHHEESAAWRCEGGEIPEESAMGQWEKVFSEGGKKFGRSFRILQDDLQKKGMEEAGFVDVVVRDFKCPIGTWPQDPRLRETGAFAKYTLDMDFEGYLNYMWSAVMGWSPDEIKIYIAHLRHQMKDKTLHTWYPHRVVYARKPE